MVKKQAEEVVEEVLLEPPKFLLRHRMDRALDHAGMTVPQMAERLGMSRVTVWGWLHGRSKPNMPTLMMWAQITQVPYDWLIGPDPKAVRDQRLPDNPGYTAHTVRV